MRFPGSALIRVGQTEHALGEVERTYIRGGHEAIIAPLQHFLDGDMRNIMRERKILENKRLDLDACKNKVRKARAMQMQPPVSEEILKVLWWMTADDLYWLIVYIYSYWILCNLPIVIKLYKAKLL